MLTRIIDKNNKLRLTNFVASVFCSRFPQWTDQRFHEHLASSGLFSYFIFQREYSESKKEHWQCYFECLKPQYYSKLKKLFLTSHLEPRRGSQAEAINYCNKVNSRVYPTQNAYQFGNPKKTTHTFTQSKLTESLIVNLPQKQLTNRRQSSLTSTILPKQKYARSSSLKNILLKIKQNQYTTFEDIEEEDILTFWTHHARLKAVWNQYYSSQDVINQTKIIWLYGKTGCGKTIWTRHYFLKAGFKNGEILVIKPETLSSFNKIWFLPEHEKCRLLIIDECQPDFPELNNFLKFIDRNTQLPTKGGHIRNNFELIIVNSLYTPEEVFKTDHKYKREDYFQVLRRIYERKFGCRVYEVIGDYDFLNQLPDDKPLNPYEMVKRYAPRIKLIERRRNYTSA